MSRQKHTHIHTHISGLKIRSWYCCRARKNTHTYSYFSFNFAARTRKKITHTYTHIFLLTSLLEQEKITHTHTQMYTHIFGFNFEADDTAVEAKQKRPHSHIFVFHCDADVRTKHTHPHTLIFLVLTSKLMLLSGQVDGGRQGSSPAAWLDGKATGSIMDPNTAQVTCSHSCETMFHKTKLSSQV